jgi:hypothetical protein
MLTHRSLAPGVATVAIAALTTLSASLGGAGAASAATTHRPATTATCSVTQLSMKAGRDQAGAGHVGFAVIFTNTGSTSCSLTGYPGVQALDKHGKKLDSAKRTKAGYLGGDEKKGPPTPVVLKPGSAASALIEGTDVPQGNRQSCPQAVAFRVTPPAAHRAQVLRRKLPACSRFEVHPVVSGKNGQSGR